MSEPNENPQRQAGRRLAIRDMKDNEGPWGFPLSAIHIDSKRDVRIDPDAEVIYTELESVQGGGTVAISRVRGKYMVDPRTIDNLDEKISDAAAPSNFKQPAEFSPPLPQRADS